MDDRSAARLVETALRCYPARWRRRHGDEAAELAALLIGDGTPAGSIAWSYLAGAAREWLIPRPGQRLSGAACALLVAVCSLGVSAGLLASAAPAKAAPANAAPAPPTRPTPAAAVPATVTGTGQESGLAPCRPDWMAMVPVVRATTHERLEITWAAGHDGFC
jgi:hypothetical protein